MNARHIVQNAAMGCASNAKVLPCVARRGFELASLPRSFCLISTTARWPVFSHRLVLERGLQSEQPVLCWLQARRIAHFVRVASEQLTLLAASWLGCRISFSLSFVDLRLHHEGRSIIFDDGIGVENQLLLTLPRWQSSPGCTPPCIQFQCCGITSYI